MTSEQETVQIIKDFIRPLVRAIVEVVKESWSEKEDFKEEKEASAPKPAFAPFPAPVRNLPVAENRMTPTRREPREEEKAYRIYQELPERLKASLRGLLGEDELSAFEHPSFSIERLWEFCKTEVQRPDGLDNSREMADIFEFFFFKLMAQGGEKLFLYEPTTGERFDPRRMTVSNAGKRIGIVETTILKGYYSSQEHNGLADEVDAIKHKAVVVLC